LVDSILPGVVLHATGDAIGICWIWWLSTHPGSGYSQLGFADALHDRGLLLNGVAAIVFGVAAVWAFRRLAGVVKGESGIAP
jgi:hypothetical protein